METICEKQIYEDLLEALADLEKQAVIQEGQILVIGTSTSEVIGQHIGTAGTKQVAKVIFKALRLFQNRTGVQLAFQCCEHLNRALVIEQTTQKQYNLEQVSVIPVPSAGGAMASFAYTQFKQPTVVEFIKADYGIDIGDTLIGMHLKHVAVPVRSTIKKIGHAHLSLAKTRPKLIGGIRAIYEMQTGDEKCD